MAGATHCPLCNQDYPVTTKVHVCQPEKPYRQPQPVTFAGLKEYFHKRAVKFPEDRDAYMVCADELELLERQVQELRDEYQAYQGYDSIVKRLTALLGKP